MLTSTLDEIACIIDFLLLTLIKTILKVSNLITDFSFYDYFLHFFII